MSRLGRAAALVLMSVVATAGIAACSGTANLTAGPSAQPGAGEQVGPVLVQGRVVDANGVAVSAASLQLSVYDYANSQVGQRVPTVFARTYTAGLNGLFEIRLAPSAELATFAKANNNYLNFDLIVIAHDGALIIPAGFTRQISGLDWVDEVPVLTISPNGVRQGNGGGVPAPLPAAT